MTPCSPGCCGVEVHRKVGGVQQTEELGRAEVHIAEAMELKDDELVPLCRGINCERFKPKDKGRDIMEVIP